MRRSRLAAKPRQHPRRPGAVARRVAPLAPYRIAALANLLARSALQQYARRFDLAIREWHVLAVLGEGWPLSAPEVSRRTAIDRRRAGRVVAGLLRRGLVEREPDAFDARRTTLRLSLKGRAIYRRIAPLAAAGERSLLAVLTAPERRQLERLLAKLHERAEAMLAQLGEIPDEEDASG
ncbi:MAG TPA: MarR family winged helix-turn-helix transcriptional regulator [Burkholderiales bacterium]|nr:MarR family winged helix-turn-helix transcriptional regulator [Burkholderiales bacterium]